MKRFFVCSFILLFCVVFSADAQNWSIKLRLVDANSGEGVGYATVSLSKEGDDAVYKYAQTDAQGAVVLKDVAEGKYVVKGILLGYEDYSESIVVKNKDLNLGSKKMRVQAEFLEGAKVTGVGNPIIVKKDTIEHNVSMMKSSDNDVLEDLLKRIPGVEVSSDGTITANGKTISKIQIDGKEFFTNDPSLASKNIPAKIVEKVRVVEKKSDQAQFTGIDDGEEETVLDLGVKKGMMNGWMGNFSAGGGSDIRDADESGEAQANDFRYQGAGFAANFKESSQLAFIGNINNTNNRGFQDMMASTMGGMRGGGMRGGNNGISNSFMVGGNGGYTFDNKSEIVANAMGNGNKRYVEQTSNRETYNSDGSTLYSKDGSKNTNWTYGIRAGGRADIKLSESSSFIFEPNFNYGWGEFDENETFTTDKKSALGLEQKVNDGLSKSTGNSTSINASGRLLWRQKLGKPGRTLSINARYSFSQSDILGNNYSLTKSYSDYDDQGVQEESIALIDQQYNQTTRTNGVNARATYTEPLGKNYYLEANYGINYSNNLSSKETFDKDETGSYTKKDETYSSDVKSDNMRHNIGLNFKKQEDKFNLTIGATLMPQRQVNSTKHGDVDTTLTLDVLNWSPNARLDINFTDHKMLRFNYRGNTTNPTMTQLMPIPDNSNPQRQSLGNLSLNPSFTHNMTIMYRGTNTETFASMHGELSGQYKPHSIVNASWTNDEGVQYTVPVNYDKPTYSANGMLMFNSPLAKSKFSIMSFTRLSYSNGVSFVGESDIDPTDAKSFLNMDNYTSNTYQNVSAMERLRLTFRNDSWEVGFGGSTTYSQAFYELTSKNVAPTWNNSIDGNVILNSRILSFSTDARYTFYYGYSEGYNDPQLVWNFEISKQFLKNQMTVAVKAYDILNQAKNTSRTTTDNYVQDKWNNTLGRYVVLTLTFRFGTFGGMKMGRGNGPDGGAGGPMGPPPGGMRP